jgi:alkylated DNA nucleotide flippase Atl1
MPIPLAAAIGLGVGLVGGIGKMFGRGKANREMSRLLKSNPTYKANPLVAQRLGLAQSLLNARMPGATAIERNLFASQANTMAGAQRNATDSSQLLALGSASQAQTNQAVNNLGIQEQQDYYNRLGSLEGAQMAQVGEDDKVYQDQVRRWQDTAQIKGMQNANRQAGWGDLSNLGFGLMQFGMAGGVDNLFSGNGAADRKFNSMPLATRTTHIQ